MRVTYILSRLSLSLLAVFILTNCSGKKNKADGAKITIIPSTPIVITADVEVAGKEIKAPWFDFGVQISNDTDYPFKVVALQADITSLDQSGQFVTKTIAWSPGELNYSTLTDVCEYSTFGTWLPGESKRLGYNGTAGCISGDALFPADGNNKGPNGTSFRYKVKLKPLGYFIDDSGNPSDRFEKAKLFYTK